ncbi:MAG TPA: helix-hairpin-helix domain-containing protein [Acidimicrobiales bacterium]|nr:helix-hairpin-helix domain-containing protein [Acidimicrobiales bacterium]
MSDSLPAQAQPSWRDGLARLRAALPEKFTPRVALLVGLVVAGLAIILVVGGWLLFRRPPAPVPIELPRAGAEAAGELAGGGAGVAPGAPQDGAAATITVAAAGAVARPGVYVVPSKSRVADVVAAAGGTVADADLDQVNLAARVADADRVFVPRVGQPVPAVVGAGPGGSGSAPGSKDNPVDLNTATAEQLDALPGVGPATAQAIISYRSSHSRFKSVDELLEVRGIGPAKFEALRTLVRVT